MLTDFAGRITDFRGLHKDETIHLYFHQHWLRLLWPVLKMCLRTALIVTAAYFAFVQLGIEEPFVRRGLFVAFTLLFLLAHFEFLSRVYCYLLYVVVITDKKIHRVKKTLFIVDDHESVDLWMIQDIEKIQNRLIQNIFSYGSIRLEAQNTSSCSHWVPRVNIVYDAIMRLREEARKGMAYFGGKKYEMQQRSYQEKTRQTARQ